MKITYLILSSIILASSSNAAISLAFSSGTTNVANGFADRNGSSTASGRIWGIIVDSGSDGFDGLGTASTSTVNGGTLYSSSGSTVNSTYEGGFSLSPTTAGNAPSGQAMKVAGNATDDILFLSSNLMALVSGEYRLTTITNLTYSGDVTAGDQYRIVWFDDLKNSGGSSLTTLSSASVVSSGRFGLWGDTTGTTAVNSTILPSDPGNFTTTTTGPAGMFAGTETNMASTLTLIPEPTSALLGAVGALLLLRRRRI